jgi:alpha-1,3-mannosyl-glycoprotein beta-1,2-N-acetylglucosaminyltransferase
VYHAVCCLLTLFFTILTLFLTLPPIRYTLYLIPYTLFPILSSHTPYPTLPPRAPSIKRVIILEEDLVIAPDFFEMLAATKDILDSDPSLMGVSAWNDNGQTTAVKDNKQMYRSDFFPGLGWMLTRTVWEELSPKWPEAYWDDWLREPKNRKDRQFLRPEVCRTLHIGQRGVSNAQYSTYLTSTLLNSDFVPFTTMDLGYLQKDRWEREFLEQVRAATPLSIADAKSSKSQSRDIRVAYDSLEGGGSSFAVLAAWAGAMNNVKAGVPRTAFRGIVSLWRGDTKVHLVPSSFQ